MSLVKDFTDLALADPAPAEPAPSHPVFLTAPLASIVLDPAPIEPTWVIAGQPLARAKLHSTSADAFSSTTIWDCTAGAFRWHFVWDETVHIIEGAVTVTDETGKVTKLSAGDVAYFAAGSWATWEISSYVKKIAFCRRAFPAPMVTALSLKARLASLLRGTRPAPSGAGLAAASSA